MGDDVSSSENSSDEDIVAIPITKEDPPLPPRLVCLMEKGNSKVHDEESEEENDSDDEIDPNDFTNLINEDTSMIKKEKVKFKVLEEVHAKLKSAHSS